MPPDIQRQEGISINHDVDDLSDGFPLFDDDIFEDSSRDTLRDIKNQRTMHLNLKGDYTDWSPQDAFRELVQNWYGRF